MTTITVTTTISMGHRLQHYNGVCKNPHGHNMKVEVEVESLSGTFLDFKTVKQTLEILTNQMDHAMLLAKDDSLSEVLSGMGFAVFFTELDPTTEHIAEVVIQHMESMYRTATVRVKRVTVYETDKYSATVRRG